MARELYEQLRREAGALKIQKNFRAFIARKSYLKLRSGAVVLQTGYRGMIARNEFRFRKQTKASVVIQVLFCRVKFAFPVIVAIVVDLLSTVSVGTWDIDGSVAEKFAKVQK